MKQSNGLGQPHEHSLGACRQSLAGAAPSFQIRTAPFSDEQLPRVSWSRICQLTRFQEVQWVPWPSYHGAEKNSHAELVRVEKRGEVSIQVEGFMVKALEDLAKNGVLHSIFGMVACSCGGDGSGTGGKIVSGCGGSFNRTRSSNIPVGSTHESQEKRGEAFDVFFTWLIVNSYSLTIFIFYISASIFILIILIFYFLYLLYKIYLFAISSCNFNLSFIIIFFNLIIVFLGFLFINFFLILSFN